MTYSVFATKSEPGNPGNTSDLAREGAATFGEFLGYIGFVIKWLDGWDVAALVYVQNPGLAEERTLDLMTFPELPVLSDPQSFFNTFLSEWTISDAEAELPDILAHIRALNTADKKAMQNNIWHKSENRDVHRIIHTGR